MVFDSEVSGENLVTARSVANIVSLMKESKGYVYVYVLDDFLFSVLRARSPGS